MKKRKSAGRYVDGFVFCVPKRKLAAYRRIASAAGKVWMDLGALEYRESAADDLNVKMGVPFARMAKAKRGESVMFSWIVYRSRAHRDSVNAKVMKDPRIARMMPSMDGVFDYRRMAYGGFRIIVSAK
jgi:uncharacterized protein YbaA (DUF1428 family)